MTQRLIPRSNHLTDLASPPDCFNPKGCSRIVACTATRSCDAYEKWKAKLVLPKLYGIYSSGGAGFFLVELMLRDPINTLCYKLPDDTDQSWTPVDPYRLIAQSANYNLLAQNMREAQALEKLLRPAWQLAVAYELQVRKQMLDAVHARAKSGI